MYIIHTSKNIVNHLANNSDGIYIQQKKNNNYNNITKKKKEKKYCLVPNSIVYRVVRRVWNQMLMLS